MILLLILLIVLGVLFTVTCLGCTLLIEPLICILAIYGLYRLIKKRIKK
jgi:hypothetical protein